MRVAVSKVFIPGQVKIYFTGLGIYYPDFRQTQRVGITPDIFVCPTLQGIKSGKDEILDSAIQYANSIIQQNNKGTN